MFLRRASPGGLAERFEIGSIAKFSQRVAHRAREPKMNCAWRPRRLQLCSRGMHFTMGIHSNCPIHDNTENAIQALDKLRLAVKIAFSNVMQSGGLPPMAALNLTAMAVGLASGYLDLVP